MLLPHGVDVVVLWSGELHVGGGGCSNPGLAGDMDMAGTACAGAGAGADKGASSVVWDPIVAAVDLCDVWREQELNRTGRNTNTNTRKESASAVHIRTHTHNQWFEAGPRAMGNEAGCGDEPLVIGVTRRRQPFSAFTGRSFSRFPLYLAWTQARVTTRRRHATRSRVASGLHLVSQHYPLEVYDTSFTSFRP